MINKFFFFQMIWLFGYILVIGYYLICQNMGCGNILSLGTPGITLGLSSNRFRGI